MPTRFSHWNFGKRLANLKGGHQFPTIPLIILYSP
ncbi:hypothetical protein I8J29_16300 [Paenibacillus sp. MWE-103]|uniref:Uncharacterized protein n=1 Tax=Paenibacillus artemisiicola TaxID=1172618 RepID=A0ABS3WBT2_9BACL|nr:hypothetical protein [Paenibacillus artemisiicola]